MKEGIEVIQVGCFIGGIFSALMAGTMGFYDKMRYGGNVGYVLAVVSTVLFLGVLLLAMKQRVRCSVFDGAIQGFMGFAGIMTLMSGINNTSTSSLSTSLWDNTIWYGALMAAGLIVWLFREKITVRG